MTPEDHQPQPTPPIDPLTIGQLITLTEAAQLTGFSTSFLRRLAIAERLKARKSGNAWLTTIVAIEEYKKSRSYINIPKKYRNKPYPPKISE